MLIYGHALVTSSECPLKAVNPFVVYCQKKEMQPQHVTQTISAQQKLFFV